MPGTFYCPALISYGGVTWGATREEALQNIHDVVQLVISDLLENGEQLPEGVQVSEELLVSVPL